jgi:hypothetical protein
MIACRRATGRSPHAPSGIMNREVNRALLLDAYEMSMFAQPARGEAGDRQSKLWPQLWP